MQPITSRTIGLEYQPRFHQSTPQSRPKCVLVVMRNDIHRHYVVEEFKNAGYMTTGKGSCREALLFCRQSRTLHALVTELELPHMWGLELSRAACQCHAHLAVLCVCADEPKAHAKREMAMRGWQWATKSSSHDVLLRELELALAKFAAG